MKLARLLLVLAVVGCVSATASERPAAEERDSKLESYFQRYCEYRGNMGIGFVSWHTYDFKYRQRLKATQDAELKRLFVLAHLYSELGAEISDFEDGVVIADKGRRRKMTRAERSSTRSSISKRLDDLSLFDPDDPQEEIAGFRKRLSRVSR